MLRTILTGPSVATDSKPYSFDSTSLLSTQIRQDVSDFALKLREYESYLQDYATIQNILANIDVMGGANYKRMEWLSFDSSETFYAATKELLLSNPLYNQFLIDLVQHQLSEGKTNSVRWRAVMQTEESSDCGESSPRVRCIAAIIHSKPNLPYLACCEIQAADFAGRSYSAELKEMGEEVPGVFGMEIYAATFLYSAWSASCMLDPRFRSRSIEVEPKGIYEIRGEVDREYAAKCASSSYPPPFEGRRRNANEEDIPTVARWLEEYHDETFPAHRPRPNFMHKARDLCTSGNGQLWEGSDGTPRGLAAYNRTISGFRSIGPVYTPKDSRGKGVASYLVLEMTKKQLEEAECLGLTLITNLLNPASNLVYKRIGYVQIGTMLRLTIIPSPIEGQQH